jgi:hypothetical protein
MSVEKESMSSDTFAFDACIKIINAIKIADIMDFYD